MSFVNLVKEVWKTSISTETEHHAGVGRHREEAAVIHAHHYKCHEHNGTTFTKYINEYLKHGLLIIASDSCIKILDRE